MKKEEFLTDEQRKGLIYGSLISAILSGGAAMRSGGNVMDAVGRGSLGAAQAFGGGIEEIAKQRHQAIEEAKDEEVIRASQESQALQKKKFTSEEKTREETSKIHRVQLAEAERKAETAKAFAGRYAQLVAPSPEGDIDITRPTLPPGTSSVLAAATPEIGMDLLGKILTQKPAGTNIYVNPAGEVTQVPKTAVGPQPGLKSPVLAAIDQTIETKKAEGAAERKSREGIAAEEVRAKKDISKERSDTAKKIADTKKDEKEEKDEGKDQFVYWDTVKDEPVKLKKGTQDPKTQLDPDKNKFAGRKLNAYYREQEQKRKGAVTPVAPQTSKKPKPVF